MTLEREIYLVNTDQNVFQLLVKFGAWWASSYLSIRFGKIYSILLLGFIELKFS